MKRVKHGLTYDFRRSKRRYNEVITLSVSIFKLFLSHFIQAKYDAFRKFYPIAHMKRQTQNYEVLPYRADFVIIGGGLTGSATAYWLKQGFRDEDLTVCVVESTDNVCYTQYFIGCIHIQFFLIFLKKLITFK